MTCDFAVTTLQYKSNQCLGLPSTKEISRNNSLPKFFYFYFSLSSLVYVNYICLDYLVGILLDPEQTYLNPKHFEFLCKLYTKYHLFIEFCENIMLSELLSSLFLSFRLSILFNVQMLFKQGLLGSLASKHIFCLWVTGISVRSWIYGWECSSVSTAFM